MTKKDCYKCDTKPSMHCGECPVWLAGEEVSEKERIAYKQGKADGRIEVFKELFENIIPTLYENDADEEVINRCKEMLEQMKGGK